MEEKSQNKIVKKVKRITIYLVLILLILTGFYFYFKMSVKTSSESFSSTVSESVVKILQLSTLEYNYTDVVSYKESVKYNNFNIPFTEKKFLVKYTGYIKAGTDLSDVEVSITDPHTINIKIHHSKITDNVINEEDLYVYDEKESIFNQLKITDFRDVFIDEKQKTEAKIIESGFLEEADQRSKDLITELLKSLGFESITITFH